MHDSGVRVFSPARDAEAASALVEHNRVTSRALDAHVESLLTVVSARASQGGTQHAVNRLVDWCRSDLLPHMDAEGDMLYRPAEDTEEGALLVQGMLAEHAVIRRLVDDVARSTEPVRAVALAGALQAVVAGHLAKESDQLAPLLVRSPYISLADALAGTVELVGPELAATA